MHITKDGATRKQELMDAALKIFCEKGYESCSVHDIIESVGVTRGAFYHYFDSKEEIMELIAENQARKIIDIFRDISENTDINAAQKLKKSFISLLEFKTAYEEEWLKITEALYKDEENIRLKGKMEEKFKKELIPLFIDIIEQGKKEGLFVTSFSEEIAEMLYVLGFHYTTVKFEIIKNRKKEEAVRALSSRVEFFITSLEKNLGLKAGALGILDEIEDSLKEMIESAVSYYLENKKD